MTGQWDNVINILLYQIYFYIGFLKKIHYFSIKWLPIVPTRLGETCFRPNLLSEMWKYLTSLLTHYLLKKSCVNSNFFTFYYQFFMV